MPPKKRAKKTAKKKVVARKLPRKPSIKARRGPAKASARKTAPRAAGRGTRTAASKKTAAPKRRTARGAAARKPDRLEEIFLLRNQWRGLLKKAISLVEGKKLKWEVNRQGRMRWYLHPGINRTSLRSLLVFMQEIPPGSRSGKQLHQGGIVHYVLKGRGYTVVNGQRHDWEAGDTISLPVLPDGIEYQHFNADSDNPAVFIAAEANLTDALGADLGSGLEQLENCPEYRG